jgi:hypothetical protein
VSAHREALAGETESVLLQVGKHLGPVAAAEPVDAAAQELQPVGRVRGLLENAAANAL